MNMNAEKVPVVPAKLLKTIGYVIALARQKKKWRQADLAERLNVSRQTVAGLEQGKPSIAAGYYFMAAWLLDVPIFQGMNLRSPKDVNALDALFEFIKQQAAQRVKITTDEPIDDDF